MKKIHLKTLYVGIAMCILTLLFLNLDLSANEDFTLPGVNFPAKVKFTKKYTTRSEGKYVIHIYLVEYQASRRARNISLSDKWKVDSRSGSGMTVYKLDNLSDFPDLTKGLVANKLLIKSFTLPSNYRLEETTISPSWNPKNVSSREFMRAYDDCLKIVQNTSYSVEKKRSLLKAKQDSFGVTIITEIVRNIPVYDPSTQQMNSLDSIMRKTVSNYAGSYDIPLKNDPIGYTIKVIDNPTIKNISEAFGLKKLFR